MHEQISCRGHRCREHDARHRLSRHGRQWYHQIALGSRLGYPAVVRSLLVLACLTAIAGSAHAQVSESNAPLTSVAPVDKAHAAPSRLKEEPGDVSKIEDGYTEKLPRLPKIKDCCGYPVGQKEGFRLSFYWLAYESEYANEQYDTPLYTKHGYYIGKFPSAFVFELKLEGSGILRDGRVLNYDGDCNYGIGTCFKTLSLAEHPLGAGVQGRRLEPFRSIAVDPRYIPIGGTVYVPELAGALMPDGTRHDGCLRADDMGGAIKEHKLDFFVESYLNFKFIADNLWWRMRATPLLEEPRCEYLRLRDPRERINDHTDWVELHKRRRPSRMAEKLAKKTARTRALAKAWLARHQKP
jgi:3D (Asp-Asp-Asp) domain-containing protein